MLAKTVAGFEPLLAGELTALGRSMLNADTRSVIRTVTWKSFTRPNYSEPDSLTNIKPIFTFTAENEQELYEGVRKVNWNDYLTIKDTFAIDAVAINSNLPIPNTWLRKLRTVLVDQFREKSGIRPSVDIANPDIRIDLHVNGQDCTLSLDSSGASLHKRGYRRNTHEARANEVLAAGLIILSEWDKKVPMVDFMCGSGTLLIELLSLPTRYRQVFTVKNGPSCIGMILTKNCGNLPLTGMNRRSAQRKGL